MAVLTATGRHVAVLLVAGGDAVVHGTHVRRGRVVDVVVDGERRLAVGGGAHEV